MPTFLLPPPHGSTHRERLAAFAILCSLWADPGWGQPTRATSTLTSVSTWMQSIGVIIITIALIFAGVKMIFGHQRITDLGGLFWGSFLIGGASLIASWFTTGTAN